MAMTENLTQAFSEDIYIRTADEQLPPSGVAFDAKDIVSELTYEKNGVRVTAIEVSHGDLIRPAYGCV